jgi:signal transduction histidine kinase
MNPSEQPYQSAHEVGKIYDAITDSKVLAEFFLATLLRFIPARQSFLFLATQSKSLLLEAFVPAENTVPEDLAAAVKKIFDEGKPRAAGGRMFLPLIAQNNAMGVACLERAADAPVFTPQEVEIGFDLASEFSGALKNSLLFEENLKMERLAAVGQAMGMVIHEIKNIMQLARFSDEMIRMGIAEKNKNFLEKGLAKMAKALKEMDGFALEMLSLTKDYQLEPEKVNLPVILAELQNDLTEYSEGYHIRLDFRTDPDFPVVEGDGRSLYRALLNLVKNAFEAFQNKADACVTLRARIKDDEHYELIIGDNASGMSEEVKARLFEAFFSTKGKRGTGLGLMVVARTVKMHYGDVCVESQPGVGTKFILTLPRSFPK